MTALGQLMSRVTLGLLPPAGPVDLVAVAGELDAANAAVLLARGRELLSAPSTQMLVVDLAEVTSIDSDGLAALVGLHNIAGRADKQLRLARPPDPVRRLLARTGLGAVFGVRDRLTDRGM